LLFTEFAAPPAPTVISYVPEDTVAPDGPLSTTAPAPPPPEPAPPAPPPPTTTYSTLLIEDGTTKLPEFTKV
jgi:hypothetical protein